MSDVMTGEFYHSLTSMCCVPVGLNKLSRLWNKSASYKIINIYFGVQVSEKLRCQLYFGGLLESP